MGLGRTPRLVLLAPMEVERHAVLEALPGASWQEDPVEGLPAQRSVVAGADGEVALLVAQIGVGTHAAGRATAALLDAEVTDHVVVVGIAGGVTADDAVGQLVVPAEAQHGLSGPRFRATAMAGRGPTGVLHTSDGLVQDAGVLAELAARGVVALDMETAAVARTCEQRGVPWSCFRALSDLAGDEHLSPEVASLTRPDGTADLDAVRRLLAADPTRAAALDRLGHDARHAAREAAATAVAACLATTFDGPDR